MTLSDKLMSLAWAGFRCGRCGEWYANPDTRCKHINTAVKDMTDEEAERVKARYAIGRKHNPDHDETSYRDNPSKSAAWRDGDVI